jgi:hypothetical protein
VYACKPGPGGRNRFGPQHAANQKLQIQRHPLILLISAFSVQFSGFAVEQSRLLLLTLTLSIELRFLLRETKVWIAKGWNRAATKTALN